jgi:hypothetical protein
VAQTRPVAPTLVPGQLLRHGLLAAPLLALAAARLRGLHGGLSAVAGLALVLANLHIAARSLDWAAGISLPVVAAVAMGGYVIRVAAITVVVLLMGHLTWVDLPALAVTLVVAHLGLLVAEARSIHPETGGSRPLTLAGKE